MNFLLVCGGTAGHINPALAIAAEICRIRPESKILFVGSGRKMENLLVPRAGYKLENIKMSGLERGISPRKTLRNINTLRNLVSAGGEAKRLIGHFKPDAAVGTGGYICYPVLKKTASKRIPTFVHESNAVPGLTTKLLSSRADNIFTSFPGLEQTYRKPERVIFTGTPVDEKFKAERGESLRGRPGGKPLVVSYWGSLGAERMNEVMVDFIALNSRLGLFDHIHAAGKSGGVSEIMEGLRKAGVSGKLPDGIDIREYIYDMPSVMARADLILCRAGGATIAELTYMGKPAVLVPSPYVTNDQQTANAKQLQNSGGAVMLEEKLCNGDVLFNTASSLLEDKEKLQKMAGAQRAVASPDALERIASLVISGAEKKSTGY